MKITSTFLYRKSMIIIKEQLESYRFGEKSNFDNLKTIIIPEGRSRPVIAQTDLFLNCVIRIWKPEVFVVANRLIPYISVSQPFGLQVPGSIL